MGEIEVKISFKWISWKLHQSWSKDILPQLYELDITENDLKRCVYIIKIDGLFAIEYPDGNVSPTLYIGEGSFKRRINSHKKNWIRDLEEIIGNNPLKIGICIPRRKNKPTIYQDLEAELLHAFKKEYGSVPLINKQMEHSDSNYNFVPETEFRSAFMVGRGVRFLWSIKPMKSNFYFNHYHKA